jgi:redox-sensitive bicupin YhaK (pirin superfamily)
MPIEFSPVMSAQAAVGNTKTFSIRSIDLRELGGHASPVVVLDDFRVRSQPFPPHPHAGFAAVTYVLKDSPGALRSRTSLGNDVVVGPGGIVWTQAGSGVIHEEVPAERDRELHGLQLFINLSAKNKLAAPRVLWLAGSDVPKWRSEARDRVRVIVGSFEGVASPLVPAEPFTLLDVELRREIFFGLPDAHNAVVYVLDGCIDVQADRREQSVAGGQALALYGGPGRVTFEASPSARFVILSGGEIREPVVVRGSFIMNDESQVKAAVERFKAGEMGHLAPLSSMTPRSREG